MKPGRKPLAEGQATSTLTVRLPETLYDDACKAAIKQGISISALIREGLARVLKDQRGACFWL